MSLRIDQELHRKAKTAARRRSATLTGFVESLAEAAVRQEEQRELFDAFSLVSEEAEEASVEFATEAQTEVVSQ